MNEFSVQTVYLYEYETVGILCQEGTLKSLVEFMHGGLKQRIWVPNEEIFIKGEINIDYREL